MTIRETRENDRLTLALEGRLDTLTAPDLEKALKKHLASVSSLTLDLTDLDYISSAGLRVLLFAHTSLAGKGGLEIRNANEIVMEVFEVTGFRDVLNIA